MTLIETQGLVTMTDEAQVRWTALGDTTRQSAADRPPPLVVVFD
ncbi:hypothetical protein AB0C13_37160 [Streptomyces sp. NPDC049099]